MKPLPFTIVEMGELEKNLQGSQITPAGRLCDDCFIEVCKATSEKFITYWCGCYARVFETGNPRASSISPEQWQAYKNASAARQAFTQPITQPIINPAKSPNYDCWCPGCRRERKLAVIGVWTLKNGQHVCSYGVCRVCREHMEKLSEESRSEEMPKIEAHLLKQYPFLKANLPDGQA
jgi:hypothetical protein